MEMDMIRSLLTKRKTYLILTLLTIMRLIINRPLLRWIHMGDQKVELHLLINSNQILMPIQVKSL